MLNSILTLRVINDIPSIQKLNRRVSPKCATKFNVALKRFFSKLIDKKGLYAQVKNRMDLWQFITDKEYNGRNITSVYYTTDYTKTTKKGKYITQSDIVAVLLYCDYSREWHRDSELVFSVNGHFVDPSMIKKELMCIATSQSGLGSQLIDKMNALTDNAATFASVEQLDTTKDNMNIAMDKFFIKKNHFKRVTVDFETRYKNYPLLASAGPVIANLPSKYNNIRLGTSILKSHDVQEALLEIAHLGSPPNVTLKSIERIDSLLKDISLNLDVKVAYSDSGQPDKVSILGKHGRMVGLCDLTKSADNDQQQIHNAEAILQTLEYLKTGHSAASKFNTTPCSAGDMAPLKV